MTDRRQVSVSFDGDFSRLTAEDVQEYLSIIGDVDSLKLQYDASADKLCYSVRFKSEASAQQSVQYLSGSKLHNCALTISSPWFEPLATKATADEEGHDSPTVEIPTEATLELPHNHLLPKDLQMDVELARYVPNALANMPDGAAVLNELKRLQQEMVEVAASLARAREKHANIDSTIGTRLRSNMESSGANRQALLAENKPLRRFCTTTLVKYNCVAPSDLFSYVSRTFGPLASCVVTPDYEKCAYQASLGFFFDEDAERFTQPPRKPVIPAAEVHWERETTIDDQGWMNSITSSFLVASLPEAMKHLGLA